MSSRSIAWLAPVAEVQMAQTCGHKQDQVASAPFVFTDTAQPMWNQFCRSAEALRKGVPSYLQPTVGKHFFTVGSTALLYHLYARVAEQLQREGQLMCPGQHGLDTWSQMDEAVVICAPAWLWHFAFSMLVIRNEMSLPVEARADPPVELQELKQSNRDPLLCLVWFSVGVYFWSGSISVSRRKLGGCADMYQGDEVGIYKHLQF